MILRKRKRQEGSVQPKIGDVVKSLNDIGDKANQLFQEREEIVTAAMLGMVARHHLLLVGAPGTAKSAVSRFLFGAVKDATTFRIQLTKFMTEDYVFGPMNAKKYREEAVVEHNIEGSLADCDFAFLDEVYNSNPPLLQAMHSVMNERIFVRHTQKVQCPLRFVMGTTNFINDSPETAAFLDRWTMVANVPSLQEEKSTFEMVRNAASGVDVQDLDGMTLPSVTLDELDFAADQASKMEFDDECLRLGVAIIKEYQKILQDKTRVSDRRKCHVLALVKAYAILQGASKVEPEHLPSLRYGVVRLYDQKEEAAFSEAATQVLGSIEDRKKVRKELASIRDALKKSERDFNNGDCPKDQAVKIMKLCKSAIASLPRRPDIGRFPELDKEFAVAAEGFKKLYENLREELGISA